MKDMTYQYVIVLFQPPTSPRCGMGGGYLGKTCLTVGGKYQKINVIYIALNV